MSTHQIDAREAFLQAVRDLAQVTEGDRSASDVYAVRALAAYAREWIEDVADDLGITIEEPVPSNLDDKMAMGEYVMRVKSQGTAVRGIVVHDDPNSSTTRIGLTVAGRFQNILRGEPVVVPISARILPAINGMIAMLIAHLDGRQPLTPRAQVALDTLKEAEAMLSP